MTHERLEQRRAVRDRLNKVLKMKETLGITELDEIIAELENELRRKEHEA